MKLYNVIKALVESEEIDVLDNDIVQVMEYLLNTIHKPETVFKIGEMVKETVKDMKRLTRKRKYL